MTRRPPRSPLFPYTTLSRSLPADFSFDWGGASYQEKKSGGTSVLTLGLAVIMVFLILRSEEHTSELQSRLHLVCRLLLEKKKKPDDMTIATCPNVSRSTSSL